MLQVKTPENPAVFEANGKTYRQSGQLGIRRFKELQKLSVGLFFGAHHRVLHQEIGSAYQDLNNRQLKFADAAVKLHNILERVKDIDDERIPPAVAICGLFYTIDGEDVREWSQATLESKAADWEAEGLAMDFFFGRAIHFLALYSLDFSNATPNTSPNPTKADEQSPASTNGSE